MTKTDRRKFLKTAGIALAGVASTGVLSGGIVLGETARKRLRKRAELIRRLKKLISDNELPKPDDTVSPVLTLDDPLNPIGKTKLYNQVSPIPIEDDRSIGSKPKPSGAVSPVLTLGDPLNPSGKTKLYNQVSPISIEDDRSTGSNEPPEPAPAGFSLRNYGERDKLVERLKKLGIEEPPRNPTPTFGCYRF